MPFDNGGVFVRDLVTNAAAAGVGRPDGDVLAPSTAPARSPASCSATGPRRAFQLPAGNDVTAPALTFAGGRVDAWPPTRAASRKVARRRRRRAPGRRRAARGVADAAAVEVWDGSGNRATATAPARRRRPPPPPPPAAAAGDAEGHGREGRAEARARSAGRKRMLVTLRFTLSTAATARLEIRTVATQGQQGEGRPHRPERGAQGRRALDGADHRRRPLGRYTAKLVLSAQGRGEGPGRRGLPHPLTARAGPSSAPRARGGRRTMPAWPPRSQQRLPGPVLMGIVNVTPDSFSDGGRFLDPERSRSPRRCGRSSEGAAIVDIGGESTRPGLARACRSATELARVLPVIEARAGAERRAASRSTPARPRSRAARWPPAPRWSTT